MSARFLPLVFFFSLSHSPTRKNESGEIVMLLFLKLHSSDAVHRPSRDAGKQESGTRLTVNDFSRSLHSEPFPPIFRLISCPLQKQTRLWVGQMDSLGLHPPGLSHPDSTEELLLHHLYQVPTMYSLWLFKGLAIFFSFILSQSPPEEPSHEISGLIIKQTKQTNKKTTQLI